MKAIGLPMILVLAMLCPTASLQAQSIPDLKELLGDTDVKEALIDHLGAVVLKVVHPASKHLTTRLVSLGRRQLVRRRIRG